MNCNKEEWYKKYKCRPIKKVKGFIWKNDVWVGKIQPMTSTHMSV